MRWQWRGVWAALAVMGLFVVGSLFGQLNQSGGTAAVSSTQSGTWVVQPGNTANTTPWLMSLSQGGNTAVVTAGGAIKIDGSGVTQPVSGTLRTVPLTACGITAFDSGAVTLPTAAAAVTTTATCVGSILFNNTTASSQTVTVTDNQATPVAYLSSFQIPANSAFVYDLNYLKMASGIKWSAANAASVVAQVVGYQ